MAPPAGLEPAYDGLEIRCLSFRLRGHYMVGVDGVEPSSLAAADFKSAEFTSFSILPNLVPRV